MRIHPLFGAGIASRSLVVTAQRRLNCYFENRSDKDRTPIACYGTPGLALQFAVGLMTSPIRGMAGDSTYLYAVIGNQFFVYTISGSEFYGSGAILSSSSGYVSMVRSPLESGFNLFLVDGVRGYAYDTAGVLEPVNSIPGFPPDGATTTTFVSGYFIVNKPNTQQFYVSGSYAPGSWNALNFGSASGYPDVLVAVDALIGNLILLCSTHLEFWQNVAASAGQPFAPILSATVEWGLVAIAARVHANSCLYFLAQSPQGGFSICEINGYQVRPVSTPDLDYLFYTFTTVSDCVALAYRIDAHPMVQFTFPTAGRSFLFDCLTRLWSETQTGVPTNTYAQRHIGNFSALVGDIPLISDYQNNNVYAISPLLYTDNGATIVRNLITRHEQKDFNVYSVDEMFCDFETGVGLASGQGSNPQVTITCSKDDGRTYLTPLQFPLGKLGQYLTRVETRRWGSARRFTWSITLTDPVKFVITSGAQSERERPQ